MPEKNTISILKDHSIRIIKAGQHASGAYVASPKFKVYNYSWFRDGSFIADAMSRVGEKESAEAFFDWAAGIIVKRKEKIRAGEILHTRYTVEGEESTEAWSNFQLDGFGILVWAMHEHAKRYGTSNSKSDEKLEQRILGRWQEAIDITVEYLVKRWSEPCHDWWEELHGIHAATLASIYAGLHAAGHPDAEKVKNAIDVKNAKLDASLIACATPFHAVSNEAFAPVLKQIEEKLVNKSGGVFRHEADVYYGGGEWLLLTCFLGWHYAEIGRLDDAKKKLERVASHMDKEGHLPEQSKEHMLFPEQFDQWVARWGKPAKPLLWSHAMFLTLASVLGL